MSEERTSSPTNWKARSPWSASTARTSATASTRTVMKQLRDAIERAGEEAKCGIIFGHGDNFCAGLDLRWAAESWKTGRSERLPFQFNRNSYFEAMARGNIPFIAALHGATLGGGLETASAAHIRVADETTYFGLPEGTRGIFIGGGGSVRVARLIGFARMQDMMLTGRVLKADEAERYGIVQYVVPKGQQTGQGQGAGAEDLQERAAVELRHHQQPAAAAGHELRRRPLLRAHGGRIHPQPEVDRSGCTSSSTRPRRACGRTSNRMSPHGHSRGAPKARRPESRGAREVCI